MTSLDNDQLADVADADDRTRQPRGERRRQQIIDAAVELFAEAGYRGTGVAALAERVGMTATGLLYYFGTKERLLHEVVAERRRNDPGVIELLPQIRLRSLRNLGSHNTERGVLTRLYLVLSLESLDRDAPLHDYFVDRYELSRNFFAQLVRDEQARGTVRDDVDPDQIGREILATVLGSEVQWLIAPDAYDYTATIEAYIDRLVDDLRP